jgi:hypothetical protein
MFPIHIPPFIFDGVLVGVGSLWPWVHHLLGQKYYEKVFLVQTPSILHGTMLAADSLWSLALGLGFRAYSSRAFQQYQVQDTKDHDLRDLNVTNKTNKQPSLRDR